MNKLIAFTMPTHLPGSGGWGNGYVAIPEGHPAYGLDYDNDIFNSISIHGGLTYAETANKYHPE